MKNITIGSAWPYCNGKIHLGHVAGLIAGDVLARYYRLSDHEVTYVSGTDSHGTPIVLSANKAGLSPAELVQKKHPQFKDLFQRLGLSFDIYSTTYDQDHYKLSQNVFKELYDKELLYVKTERNPYCTFEKRFLPDTFVVGTCPHCGYTKAQGNQCENCSSILSPSELIDIRSKEHGDTIEFRNTEQFYFALEKLAPLVTQWFNDVDKSSWRSNAVTITQGWLDKGLKDRPVSRDLEWGIPVPIPGYEEKRIYVWFEAVLGYISASRKILDTAQFESHWQNPEGELIFVHGKDNVPFHTIIFPAILLGLEDHYTLPTQIVSSEYLLLEDKKFSKSSNWAVWLQDVLDEFEPDLLKFYLILHGPESHDASFSWLQFQEAVNTVLLGKYANLYNRVNSLLLKHVGQQITPTGNPDSELLAKLRASTPSISKDIEQGNLRRALFVIRDLAIEANVWLNDLEPWKKVKTNKQEAINDLYSTLLVIAEITLLLRPFIPNISALACNNLGIDNNLRWGESISTNFTFNIKPGYLVKRISDEKISELQGKLG